MSSGSRVKVGSSNHSSISVTGTSSEGGPPVVSFLDRLRAPKPSKFSRKRALD